MLRHTTTKLLNYTQTQQQHFPLPPPLFLNYYILQHNNTTTAQQYKTAFVRYHSDDISKQGIICHNHIEHSKPQPNKPFPISHIRITPTNQLHCTFKYKKHKPAYITTLTCTQ